MKMILFSSFWFQSLIEAHDNVLFKTFKPSPLAPVLASPSEEMKNFSSEPVLRVIGLYKTSSEPLVSHFLASDLISVCILNYGIKRVIEDSVSITRYIFLFWFFAMTCWNNQLVKKALYPP